MIITDISNDNKTITVKEDPNSLMKLIGKEGYHIETKKRKKITALDIAVKYIFDATRYYGCPACPIVRKLKKCWRPYRSELDCTEEIKRQLRSEAKQENQRT